MPSEEQEMINIDEPETEDEELGDKDTFVSKYCDNLF